MGYLFDLRQGSPASDDLVVMFSPSGQFSLYKHDFDCDVLFVSDPARRYYLRNARRLAGHVLETVTQGQYRRVIFFGTSKGGFGALSIARICARRRRGRVFHVLALSPQTSLYPQNDGLTFASYKNLLKATGRLPVLAKLLHSFGDVTDIGRMPNTVVEIVYARESLMDRDEALAVQGRNVTHHAVRGATHDTAFYFLAHELSHEKLRARIDRAYSRTGDKDLMQSKPTDVGALIDDVMTAAQTEPTLNQLLMDVMSREPARPQTIASRDGLAYLAFQVLMWAESLKSAASAARKS